MEKRERDFDRTELDPERKEDKQKRIASKLGDSALKGAMKDKK